MRCRRCGCDVSPENSIEFDDQEPPRAAVRLCNDCVEYDMIPRVDAAVAEGAERFDAVREYLWPTYPA